MHSTLCIGSEWAREQEIKERGTGAEVIQREKA